MDARHRVGLVTGANRGLGLETSRELLAKGLTVVMVGRDEAALSEARAGLPTGDQSRAVILRMDVTDSRSIADAHRIVRERVGPVDVLVNNAAVLISESDDVLSIPTDAYRRTFDTNRLPCRSARKAWASMHRDPIAWSRPRC